MADFDEAIRLGAGGPSLHRRRALCQGKLGALDDAIDAARTVGQGLWPPAAAKRRAGLRRYPFVASCLRSKPCQRPPQPANWRSFARDPTRSLQHLLRLARAAEILPLTETATPADQAALALAVREAYESSTPVYPLGGGTALAFGLPGKRAGLGLSLAGLTRVVDYPSRDMTITVEAGISMSALAAELAREGQRLPIDAAESQRATLGGVIATNFSGPRRYGHGTVRDYVIGISAVDGRGVAFKGGGRVVKNVAGYDFCKLLTGSLGTLAVITQVTLKVKPLPQAAAWLACNPADLAQADALLAGLVTSKTTPTAIELALGRDWQKAPPPAGAAGDATLLVGFEGTRPEVDWQLEQLGREWREQGVSKRSQHLEPSAHALYSELAEFGSSPAPLVLKFNVRPGAVVGIVGAVRAVDAQASLLAHAGNGIVLASFHEFSPADISKVLVQRLQPAAVAAGGNVVVWSCGGGELTRQAVWGAPCDDAAVMRSVKEQFDPRELLNPGRFVYGTL